MLFVVGVVVVITFVLILWDLGINICFYIFSCNFFQERSLHVLTKHLSEKNPITFYFTYLACLFPPIIVLYTYNVKKYMVDLICYNYLNLNITNFTFIIAHFIVVSIHLFSPRGKQIFVDM